MMNSFLFLVQNYETEAAKVVLQGVEGEASSLRGAVQERLRRIAADDAAL